MKAFNLSGLPHGFSARVVVEQVIRVNPVVVLLLTRGQRQVAEQDDEEHRAEASTSREPPNPNQNSARRDNCFVKCSKGRRIRGPREF